MFALFALVYVLGVVFESQAEASRSDAVLATLFPKAGAAEVSPREQLAHMEWRASVNLLIGSGLAAALVALHAIASVVRRAPLQLAAIAGLASASWLAYVILVDSSEPIAFMEQVKRLVEKHGSDRVDGMAALAMVAKRGSEAVAFLVGIGAASIVVLPETIDATDLSRRVRALRLLLYTSAVLFVVVILMTEATYTWFISFFDPKDDRVRSDLASIVATGTLTAGAWYTLCLTALYVPAAVALGHVCSRLGEVATSESSDDDVAEWMEKNGLSISWRGQLLRVATLLAPVVSSGLAQVLAEAA